jgi:oligosaccharyltransferase complex subunit beta
MLKKIISVFLLFSFLLSCTQSKKTLVLLDDWHNVEINSMFWNQITQMGYELDFKMANDKEIKLTNFGEYIYENIIFFAPTYVDSKKNEITVDKLLKFIDDGHDLMIFGSSDAGKFIRNLVNEFGADFDDYDSLVKDSVYLHEDSDESGLNKELLQLYDDETIISKNVIGINNIFHSPKGYILYKGIGMDLDPQNKYVFPILSGDKNSYSVSKNTGEVYSNGEHLKLVTGYQTRNNKRVVVLGSMDVCSDKFYYLSMTEDNKSMEESPNYKFCQDLLNWNFQRTGVLKFENVKHNNNKGESLETYRIKDYLEYYIDILEYDYTTDSWKSYEADDIQLSFIMMNPYYINQLKKLHGKPTYYAKFRAPEKHGVFKFIVDYHRTGYSYIFSSTKVPLRPFYHNEYPRFIPCAYPYYISVFVILGGFILFSILFLYGKEQEGKPKNE